MYTCVCVCVKRSVNICIIFVSRSYAMVFFNAILFYVIGIIANLTDTWLKSLFSKLIRV